MVSLNWAQFSKGQECASFCGIVATGLHAEPSRSKPSSGWRGVASSGHLGNSARTRQSSVAVRDGVRPRAPPHSIEFSWRGKGGKIQTDVEYFKKNTKAELAGDIL